MLPESTLARHWIHTSDAYAFMPFFPARLAHRYLSGTDEPTALNSLLPRSTELFTFQVTTQSYPSVLALTEPWTGRSDTTRANHAFAHFIGLHDGIVPLTSSHPRIGFEATAY